MKTIILLLLLLPTAASATEPEVLHGVTEQRELCHRDDKTLKPVCRVYTLPVVDRDTRRVDYIFNSSRGPGRMLEDIPNYGLAKWHHWLFERVLFRAQRQYADCVGQIRILQLLLGVPANQLVDSPTVPWIEELWGVREYVVPFEPISQINPAPYVQNTTAYTVAHAQAALDSLNINVYYLGLCEGTRDQWYAEAKKRMRK